MKSGAPEYVSVIQFDSSARTIFANVDVRNAQTNLPFSGGGTSFDPALNQASQLCASAKGIPVIIFMSDGEGSYSGVMKNIYSKYSSAGLLVHTVAFGSSSGETLLQTIASDGYGKFHKAIGGIQLMSTFAAIASSAAPLRPLASMIGSKLTAAVSNKIVIDYL